MRKNSGNIKKVSSPEVQYAVSLDYVSEIRKEEAISEDSIRGLSLYRGSYDEEIFHALDWCYYRLADNSGDSA
jgi:hypothetical protein